MKTLLWSLVVLCLACPTAEAGSLQGGVLVVHSSVLAYSLDITSYNGLCEVACGQDGPPPPFLPECPPYDPYDGAIPCVPTAANPTSPYPDERPQVWFVLAAFGETSCPRLKSVIYGIEYDESQVVILNFGRAGMDYVEDIFQITMGDWVDGSSWPSSRSAVAESYLRARTSLLQELYWFAGYSYGPATFAIVPTHPPQQPLGFIDDSIPPDQDVPVGLGVLGLGGITGWNPVPHPGVAEGACCYADGSCSILDPAGCAAGGGTYMGDLTACVPDPCPPPTPNERSSWGRLKNRYH